MMGGYTLLIKALGVNELRKIKLDEKKKMKKVNKQESERKYKRQNKKRTGKRKKNAWQKFYKKARREPGPAKCGPQGKSA